MVGWLFLGVALLLLIVVIVLPTKAAPDEALSPVLGSDAATAPRRRFQQLVELVSASVEGGNDATARELTQQALSTFELIPLEERDVDCRYHVAMLRAVVGNGAGALEEADSILAASPGNLFGYYVRGVVARLRTDPIGERAAATEFSARFRSEMAKARPEYLEHRQLLEAFLQTP